MDGICAWDNAVSTANNTNIACCSDLIVSRPRSFKENAQELKKPVSMIRQLFNLANGDKFA